MRKLTYENLMRNPEQLWELQQAARRERAAAVGDFFRRLFKAQEPRRAEKAPVRNSSLRSRLA